MSDITNWVSNRNLSLCFIEQWNDA